MNAMGVLVQGKINQSENGVKIIASRIVSLELLHEQKQETKPKSVMIKISKEDEDSNKLNELKEILKNTVGKSPVILYYEKNKKTIQLSDIYNVEISDNLINIIEKLFGEDSIAIR